MRSLPSSRSSPHLPSNVGEKSYEHKPHKATYSAISSSMDTILEAGLENGMALEVCDAEHIWSSAKIIDITRNDEGEAKEMTISYDGWDTKWNETIDCTKSTRITKAMTFTLQFKCLVSDYVDHCDYWPCIVNIRTPNPLSSQTEYNFAESRLKEEPNVFIEPYGPMFNISKKRRATWHDVRFVHKWTDRLSNKSNTNKTKSKNEIAIANCFDLAYDTAKHDTTLAGLPDDLFDEGSLVHTKYRIIPSDLEMSELADTSVVSATISNQSISNSTNKYDVEEEQASQTDISTINCNPKTPISDATVRNEAGRNSSPIKRPKPDSLTKINHPVIPISNFSSHVKLEEGAQVTPNTHHFANKTAATTLRDDRSTNNAHSVTPISNIADPDTNPYLERIRQKREQNSQRLKELGLLEINENMKNTHRNNALTTPSRRPKKINIEPSRRSSRKANKPALYSGEEIDFTKARVRLGEESVMASLGPVRKKQKRKPLDLGGQISNEKRISYKNIPNQEWVEDMKYFLERDHSVVNVERTMRVVRKLSTGEGVRHPQTGAFFKRNVPIALSDDFRAMHDEASEWVEENGGDKGHGWMIQHPVSKCFLYQRARAENAGPFCAKK